jgi:3-isopropylmalate/(R)-2-methylmalate dehydratase small subunit
MNKIVQVTGRGIPLRGNDIDTDRIIPARFLKTTSFKDLANAAFYDERFDAVGNKKDHPFNQERFAGANILVVNRSFGCGSSREHAPQALKAFGINAIVGESFAEIFAGNCNIMGIPAVRLGKQEVNTLQDIIESTPQRILNINLQLKTIDILKSDPEEILRTMQEAKPNIRELSFQIEIDESVRKSLIEGTWDPTSQLVAALPQTRDLAQRLPYISGFGRRSVELRRSA